MVRSFWRVARVVAVGRSFRRALPGLRPLAAVCCGAAPLVAQSPPAAPPPGSLKTPFAAKDSDQLLTIAVTKAVAAEPALAGLNLTIDVINRVAVVGGPVPDAECEPRLVAVLATVPGLSRAKISVWVAMPANPFASRVAEKLRAKPSPDAPPYRVAKAAPPADEGTGLGPLVLWPDRPRAGPVRSESAPPLLVMAPLGAPDVGGIGATPHAVLKRELPPASAAGEAPASKLARRLEAVRTRKPEWAGLGLSAEDGVVTISGTAARHSVALGLAEALQGVEGVRRIRVGSVAAQ